MLHLISGPPEVSTFPAVKVTEGNNVEIRCKVRSFPLPHTITWLKSLDKIDQRNMPGHKVTSLSPTKTASQEHNMS